MSHAIDALVSAHNECKEWKCLNSKDELRLIGEEYAQIVEPDTCSTESVRKKYIYKVVSHEKVFRYRRDGIAYFEWIVCIECISIQDIGHPQTKEDIDKLIGIITNEPNTTQT